jgi:hypothetical protein
MTEDLQDKNFRLRNKITKLLEAHPELEKLEVIVNEIALNQKGPSPEQVQANLQERARAIIEAKPEFESYFDD